MFKDSIPGLDKILMSDIPMGGVIIIYGTAGSLKSAFVYNLLSQYLKENKMEKGLYITLEESRDSHKKNMKSLGINIEKRLKISDLASFRAHIGFEDMDYLDLIIKRTKSSIKSLKEANKKNITTSKGKSSSIANKNNGSNVTCFALDSLNALYSLIDLDKRKIRNKLLEFFTFLRKNKLTSFVVLELDEETKYSEEFYLADGIIEFGITSASQDTLKRYIQIKKMRATNHSLDPFLLEIGKSGLKVVGKLL
jgi:KaiC/GvpD/RAD55 family RecA-like ATPase